MLRQVLVAKWRGLSPIADIQFAWATASNALSIYITGSSHEILLGPIPVPTTSWMWNTVDVSGSNIVVKETSGWSFRDLVMPALVCHLTKDPVWSTDRALAVRCIEQLCDERKLDDSRRHRTQISSRRSRNTNKHTHSLSAIFGHDWPSCSRRNRVCYET